MSTSRRAVPANTNIFPDNGPEASQPQQPCAANLIHPQALTAEHGLADPLAFVLLDDILRGGQVAVMAHGPGLAAREADARDVAEHRRRQEELAGAGESRVTHLPARDQLLHAKLEGTS